MSCFSFNRPEKNMGSFGNAQWRRWTWLRRGYKWEKSTKIWCDFFRHVNNHKHLKEVKPWKCPGAPVISWSLRHELAPSLLKNWRDCGSADGALAKALRPVSVVLVRLRGFVTSWLRGFVFVCYSMSHHFSCRSNHSDCATHKNAQIPLIPLKSNLSFCGNHWSPDDRERLNSWGFHGLKMMNLAFTSANSANSANSSDSGRLLRCFLVWMRLGLRCNSCASCQLGNE